jgi:opacity protein-like surface antigen
LSLTIVADIHLYSRHSAGSEERQMVKKYVTASLVALAAHGAVPAALAADLPARKAAPPPVAAAPLFTWTGFHLGFNRGFGGGVSEADVGFAAPPGIWSTRTSDRASGWITGLQAGYDHQLGNNVVLGVETDLQWSDIETSHQAATATSDPALTAVANTSQRLQWFGTTRARLGYSFGRLLPFVTGGVAYGETSVNSAQSLPGIAVGVSQRATGVGWAAGAGVDVALSDRLSARADYLYLQLPGAAGVAAGFAPANPALAGTYRTGAAEAHLVRGGMNYRFAGFGDLVPAAPQGDLLNTIKGLLFQDPALDWSGVYAGANGGYGGNVLNLTTAASAPGFGSVTNLSDRSGGAVAGGQIGYQLQFARRFVLGVETDAQWSGVTAAHQETGFGWNGAAAGAAAYGMDWFGTTRARLGRARGSSLTFVTGGVAYGGVSVTGAQAGAPLTGANATPFGWTVGSGSEYALTDKLSLKADYLYVSLNGASGQAVAVAPGFSLAQSYSTGRIATHVTRVGLNWRFGLPVR